MSRYDQLNQMTDRQLADLIRRRGRETGTADLVEVWFSSVHPGHLDMVAFILEQEND